MKKIKIIITLLWLMASNVLAQNCANSVSCAILNGTREDLANNPKVFLSFRASLISVNFPFYGNTKLLFQVNYSAGAELGTKVRIRVPLGTSISLNKPDWKVMPYVANYFINTRGKVHGVFGFGLSLKI